MKKISILRFFQDVGRSGSMKSGGIGNAALQVSELV